MALEIMRPGTPWLYRINEFNPLVVERRQNKPRARWEMYRLCRSAEEARSVVLRLEKKGEQAK